MTVFNFISLFGGLALFLYGMRIMGSALKKGSSGALKKAMEKVTNNPFMGFLLGALVTCVIQSSTATIVLTSGLVGAGIITLHQSIGIIIGANVGTTVTGQIIRLLDVDSGSTAWLEVFKPSTLAPIALIVGIVLLMAFRFKNSETIGTVAVGFGILFTGLLNITSSVAPLSESPAFAELFVGLADKPFLGFLAGAGVAFSLQSSSATIGILQALSMTGKLTFGSIYSIIIGIYVGDCVTTAIVCSIGAKADAKRTGLVHILFNLGEVVLVSVGVTALHSFGVLDPIWSVPITSGGIANAHTLFNLACAVILLPFCGLLEKLARKIIRDDKEKPQENHPRDKTVETLDKTFYSSPALALSAANGAISVMAALSRESAFSAFDHLYLDRFDVETVKKVEENESVLDDLADKTSDYLIRLSPFVDADHGNDKLNYYLKCVTEFERIGDHAVNLTENSTELYDKNVDISDPAKAELAIVRDALGQILDYAGRAYTELDLEAARKIEPLEEVVDDLVTQLRTNHFDRLRIGDCNSISGYIFLDILVNIERIADQCSNIGIHTITLFDRKAAEMQHEYIRSLHKGDDPEFNRSYKELHELYFSRLEQIG